MAKILPLRATRPEKFGYKKAGRHALPDTSEDSQLDLFSRAEARILPMPARLGAFEEALLFDDRGNAEKAEKAYRRAIEQGDCVADAYCNLGIIESEVGHIDRAIECFKNSLKADTALFETHYNLANVYFDLGAYRPAQVHYEIGASLDPTFANLFYNLALTLAMQEDFEGAVGALESYRRLSDDVDAEKALGLLESLRQSMS